MHLSVLISVILVTSASSLSKFDHALRMSVENRGMHIITIATS